MRQRSEQEQPAPAVPSMEAHLSVRTTVCPPPAQLRRSGRTGPRAAAAEGTAPGVAGAAAVAAAHPCAPVRPLGWRVTPGAAGRAAVGRPAAATAAGLAAVAAAGVKVTVVSKHDEDDMMRCSTARARGKGCSMSVDLRNSLLMLDD